MASIASSSTTTIASDETLRTEAGPLPSKRGEIGFIEGADNTQADSRHADQPALPARHPADRDTPATATITTPLNPAAGTAPVTPLSPATPTSAAQKEALRLKNKIIFCGFHLGTFLTFWAQFILLGGTIAAWAVATIRFSQTSNSTVGSTLFIHVGFGMAVLVQLFFLERCLYRLRGERYSHLHPGEVLPTSHRRWGRSNTTTIAFSPWNRPPLPTYAAALAQSGAGTGDVEDHIIAAPPPPAYGNTRGSTMLLSGYLRDSLRAQRPVSVYSQMVHRDDRPVSYASKDERREDVQDVQRARRLEDTLSQLERAETRG